MMRNKTKKELMDDVKALIEDAKENVRLLQLSNHRERQVKRAAGQLRYDLHNLSLSKDDRQAVISLVDAFLESL